MRRLVLVVVLAACRHPEPASAGSAPNLGEAQLVDQPANQPTLSCADALAAVVKFMGSGDASGYGAQFVQHCDADAWSLDIRTCFKRQPAADIQVCVNMLSNHQREELGEDIKAHLPPSS